MNKKTLLLVIPALMVLSSCGARPAEKPVELPAASMSEETVAREEGARALLKQAPLKAPTLNANSVKIGYQIQFDDKGNENDTDDTISIRFVAALKDRDVTAFWHRGLAQDNGYEGAEVSPSVWKYKFNDGTTHESTVFYDVLNNGGTRVVAGEGDFEDYECFAVYTLMNIPYNYYSNAYLAAYVTLNGENTINSQGLAVRIERNGDVSSHKFYFNPNVSDHFLAGCINGDVRDGSDNDTHKLLREDEEIVDSASNYASFSNLDLLTSDYFGAFYFSPTNFQFFGFNYFFGKSHGFFGQSGDITGYATPIIAGNYNLYMKNNNNHEEENFVYGYANSYTSVQNGIYLYPGLWQAGGAEYRMYCWDSTDDSKNTWVAPSDVSPDLPNDKGNLYLFVLDQTKYDSFKFVRMNPSRDKDAWNDETHHDETARVWNESSNHSYNFIHTDGAASLFKVNDWNNSSSIMAVNDFMATVNH